MLERAGIGTGLELSKLTLANHWLAGVMNRKLPGMVAHTPPFPMAS